MMLGMGYGILASSGGGGGGGYVANATDFSGTNQYMAKGVALTGVVNSKTGIFSAWVRLDGGDGANMGIYNNVDTLTTGSSGLIVRRQADGKFRLEGFNDVAATFPFRETSVSTYTSGASWIHLLAAWDTTTGGTTDKAYLYIDGVNERNLISLQNFDMQYTSNANFVAGVNGATDDLNGCLSDVYFAPGQFLDFSVQSNREKFRSAAGKPVYLGANGELPTGTSPAVFFTNPFGTFSTNLGTGGNFSQTAGLTAASTSPSD